MDGQKSQAKLTRTQSSLLRSSPTIRSSIHSLSSINEDEMIASQEEEKKPHRSGSTPRTGSHRFASVLAMASLTFCTLSFLFFFFFFYLRREEIPTSENLLLALIFVAIALFSPEKTRVFFTTQSRFSNIPGTVMLGSSGSRRVMRSQYSGLSVNRRRTRCKRQRELCEKAWSFTVMVISTKGSFTKEGATEVGFTITL